VKSSGTLTISQTNLALSGNSKLTSDEALSFVTLNLNDFKLTLGSSTSDLTVQNAITIDTSTEGILTGGADLLLSALSLSAGDVTSTGGIVSLSGGGQLSGTGILDVSGSTTVGTEGLVLGGDFVKSSGTLTISQTNLALSGNSKFTSDEALSFVNLKLNDFTLTLDNSTSDLTVQNAITIDTSTEGISTGEADLTLESDVTLANGKLKSTSGELIFRQGGTQSGSSVFDLGASILYLGADYTKSGGNLLSSSATLDLLVDLTITSDSALSFNQLNLNNLTLTLGSVSSDLQVSSALILDNVNEGVMTGAADLSLLAFQDISIGGVTSTGGTISLLAGGQLSGTGKLDVSGSTWVLGGNFVKSSGTLTISQTNLELSGNSTLTSDEALGFVTLNLNDFTLTLGSKTSDLTVTNAITIDASTEGISTGKADLILKSALTMSNGLLESSGGTIKLARGQTSIFSGNAFMMLDGTLLTSDDGIGIAFIEIDGEPDLSMTDSSHISYITLTTTANTVGSISTSKGDGTVGVNCLSNCTGFIETGAYGFNIHGLYRKVTSANWMLSESPGERKTATLAVKLLSRPLSDVQVVLSSSDLSEATLDKYLLSFTPSTWNRVQELTITGEDDDVVDDDVRVRILGYTDSTDANYATDSAPDSAKTHAFKYTFTNINDDLQKGLSPIVQIGADQKVNEQTRVILDGSASYDPDPTGRIVSYKWKYVGQRTDVTITSESESIAYFTGPDISETTVMLFGLEVIDDDKTASYGSTSVTIVPVQEITAVGSAVGSIEPKYPEDITLDSVETASDGSKNLQLISGTSTFITTLGVTMNLDGTASSSVKTEDNSSGEQIITSTKVNLPLGVNLNMNKDASLSISKELDGNVFLTTNISADGAVTVGVVSTNGIGPNLKAPKGSEVTIATDGTSSISMPASTDSTSGITTQVVSTLSPDGSTQIEMSYSDPSGRTTNADGSSGISKSTLSTDAGLSVAIDTSSGVTASMAVTEGTVGTLTASLASDGTSSTSFDTWNKQNYFQFFYQHEPASQERKSGQHFLCGNR